MGSCPKRFVFRHGWGKYHGAVPGNVPFQARVVSFIWGRAQKAMFSGTVGGNTWGRSRKGSFSGTGGQFHMGSFPESNVFRHGWGKYHGVVPRKVRFLVIWTFGVMERQQSSVRTALWPSRPERLTCSRRILYFPATVPLVTLMQAPTLSS